VPSAVTAFAPAYAPLKDATLAAIAHHQFNKASAKATGQPAPPPAADAVVDSLASALTQLSAALEGSDTASARPRSALSSSYYSHLASLHFHQGSADESRLPVTAQVPALLAMVQAAFEACVHSLFQHLDALSACHAAVELSHDTELPLGVTSVRFIDAASQHLLELCRLAPMPSDAQIPLPLAAAPSSLLFLKHVDKTVRAVNQRYLDEFPYPRPADADADLMQAGVPVHTTVSVAHPANAAMHYRFGALQLPLPVYVQALEARDKPHVRAGLLHQLAAHYSVSPETVKTLLRRMERQLSSTESYTQRIYHTLTQHAAPVLVLIRLAKTHAAGPKPANAPQPAFAGAGALVSSLDTRLLGDLLVATERRLWALKKRAVEDLLCKEVIAKAFEDHTH
jgi:hypothetical protein